MRSAYAALAYSMAHPTIPYFSVSGSDGLAREIEDLSCARSVMADYDVMPIEDMLTATRMWQRTENKRTDTPLIGAPLYFPNYGYKKSGHVCEYAGDGMGWTTPIWLDGGTPYQGKHLASIADIAELCGNAYAGWGADIAGMPIDFTPPATEQEKAMDTSYISDRTRYALIDVMLEGGYSLTSDRLVAEGYSLRVVPSRGPVYTRDAAQFDVTIAQAAAARKQYLADRVALGDVHVDQADVVKAIAAQGATAAAQSKALADAIATLTAVVKSNGAQGLSAATISSIASKVATAVKAALPKKITGTLE